MQHLHSDGTKNFARAAAGWPTAIEDDAAEVKLVPIHGAAYRLRIGLHSCQHLRAHGCLPRRRSGISRV
jgi:hypothetical protein